ncbi:MAG: hypothetical protein ABJD11_11685 [Gemmatimonadota bacterium]
MKWSRSKQPPPPEVVDWFSELAGLCFQVRMKLRKIRSDGSVDLESGEAVELFFRMDLFNGLLAILSNGRYGWTDALESFTDPIFRATGEPDAVSTWGRSTDLGKASSELVSAFDLLLIAFENMEDWDAVGRLLRRVFIQVCRELILVESELARIGDL